MPPAFDGSVSHTAAALRQLPQEQLAYQLALCLDIADESADAEALSGDDLTARVLALSVPADSKIAILDLYHNPQPVAEAALPLLEQAVTLLQQALPQLQQLCRPFTEELRREGVPAYLAKTSGLSAQAALNYQLHPFLFGLDTNLALTVSASVPTVQMYCGIHRGALQAMLQSTRGIDGEVYQAMKLLGDRTRFDILCYLRDRQAYGQELSNHFGLSRNTIHHHMNKLLQARLVTCTVDGNRVYYAIDQATVRQLLAHQQRLLLPPEA